MTMAAIPDSVNSGSRDGVGEGEEEQEQTSSSLDPPPTTPRQPGSRNLTHPIISGLEQTIAEHEMTITNLQEEVTRLTLERHAAISDAENLRQIMEKHQNEWQDTLVRERQGFLETTRKLEEEHKSEIQLWEGRVIELAKRCKRLEEDEDRRQSQEGRMIAPSSSSTEQPLAKPASSRGGSRKSRLSIRSTARPSVVQQRENSPVVAMDHPGDINNNWNNNEAKERINALKLIEKMVSQALEQLDSPAKIRSEQQLLAGKKIDNIITSSNENEQKINFIENDEEEASANQDKSNDNSERGSVDRIAYLSEDDYNLHDDTPVHPKIHPTNTTNNNNKPNDNKTTKPRKISFRGDVYTQLHQFELNLDFELGQLDEDKEEEGSSSSSSIFFYIETDFDEVLLGRARDIETQ